MIITQEMRRLQRLIDNNAEAAESGDPTAQILVVNAEEELDGLLLALSALPRPRHDEQFEADMLDLAGCSDPYAPARPSDYGEEDIHGEFEAPY